MSEEIPSAAERERAVRSYYEALDNHEYERLASILAAGFVHVRPDRTLDGRDRFIEFMRDERPTVETTHPLEAIFRTDQQMAVQGRLLDASGDEITGFVDVFSFDMDGIARIETYTD